MGTVRIGDGPAGSTATLTADVGTQVRVIADPGFMWRFLHWSDGHVYAVRDLTITEDLELIASFYEDI